MVLDTIGFHHDQTKKDPLKDEKENLNDESPIMSLKGFLSNRITQSHKSAKQSNFIRQRAALASYYCCICEVGIPSIISTG